jgi:hypothetical protein
MPAETKIQTQAEVEEKMVDLPDSGSDVEVEISDTKKTINPEEDTPAVETEVKTEKLLLQMKWMTMVKRFNQG